MEIINLFGGPGSGKSTTAAGVFSALKIAEISVELVTEYAKDLTWDESPAIQDQMLVFAEQRHRLWRLDGKVKYVVTDSPLLTGLVYSSESDTFNNLVWESHRFWPSRNYLLKRVKKFDPVGRNQTEQQAVALDAKFVKLLAWDEYTVVPGGTQQAIDKIVLDVLIEEGI